MATIIEQENDTPLNEGEELGNLDELVAAKPETTEEAAPPEEKDEDIIPEKFKGKGVKDILHSYEELEKAYGRRNNEYGELRKLVDDVIKRDLNNLELSTGGTPAQKKKIEVGDLLDDPDTALNEAVASNPRIQKLEEQILLQNREKQRQVFETRHPDWKETIADTQFQNWVTSSPIRLKMFQEADAKYDYDTGSELLDLYKQIYSAKVEGAKQEQKENRDKALRAASVEKGSTGQSAKKVFKRTDIIRMMQTNRDKYNDPAFQAELAKAYEEGRVR